MIANLSKSAVLVACAAMQAGCVWPGSWRSDPPWLTAGMGEGLLVSEVARNIPLGATRKEVLENLRRCEVKPFAEIEEDGDSGQDAFDIGDGIGDPQFKYSSDHPYQYAFAYLDENYFIEVENRIAILVGSYRAKPPPGTFVSWAGSVEGEVVVEFEDNLVHTITFRPLDSEGSKAVLVPFEIKKLR